jgi:GT2 family glycosyltransferase
MKLTFCINTARNERYHLELLFKSLYKNLASRDHDILVYVENDNQGSADFLKTQKANFPNLKIIINPLPVPIGYARNINMMFDMAQTDVVTYLQSDMVICKDYDLEVVKNLTPDTIISSTRIEPRLHPPSGEKITANLGVDPKTFDLDAFTTFAETSKRDELTDYWFAPFTLYKKLWTDIGGHDTLFRKSREDSDLLYRFSMSGVKIKQTWRAIVYHFTCTSSRGIEWWKLDNAAKTHEQQQADIIEMTRFLRKWPAFKHNTTFNPEKEYKYHISANIQAIPTQECIQDIITYNFFFQRIYIDNPQAREIVKKQFEGLHTVANSLLNISEEQWTTYRKYYRTVNASDIFVDVPITTDNIIATVDLHTVSLKIPLFSQLNDIVHEARNEGPGDFECGNIHLHINQVVNKINDNIVVKNPPIDDINFEIL